MKKALVIVALVAMCATLAQGAIVTFTGNGKVDGDAYDTTIASTLMPSGYYYNPKILNYGANVQIMTRGTVSKGLLRFDLSALDGLVNSITSVTLRLYVNEGEGLVGVYRISDANSGWSEGDAAAGGMSPPPSNCATTWSTKFQNANLWAGGQGAPVAITDFDATPLAIFNTTGSVGSYVDIALGGDLTELITTWSNDDVTVRGIGSFSDPNGTDTPNEGMFLISDGTSVYFSSAQGANLPQLIVEGDIIPEPATMSLLAVGGLAALLRRRRA